MKVLLPSKAVGQTTFHPLSQAATTTFASSSSSTSAPHQSVNFDEVNRREQEKGLEDFKNGTGKGLDTLMPPPPPPPPPFNGSQQPPFTPSTPGMSMGITQSKPVSKAVGKRKAEGDDNARNLARPSGSTKEAASVSGKSGKSSRVTVPEAFQQMGTEIRGLNATFGIAANALQEHTTHTITHSVDPIPLRRWKAITQLQQEGLEDKDVVAIIKHFTRDISIADSYLAINKDSIRRLFLQDYID
jgi:hypothetical protein